MRIDMQAKRQIVLDTETTGLDPESGHRIIEVACLELSGRMIGDKVFHQYINPRMAVPEESYKVHGISDAMLADKPVFSAIAAPLRAFLSDAELIVHNAPFDIGFLRSEFARADGKVFEPADVIDTLLLARRTFPGQRNDLDSLCRRLKIDLSQREKHGALIDARLLAHAYLEMTGGAQASLALANHKTLAKTPVGLPEAPRPSAARLVEISPSDDAAHQKMRATLAEK